MIEIKFNIYYLLFYLIFCNNIIFIKSEKAASCLGYNGDQVDWWFLLSKQTPPKLDIAKLGGGYIYVDSTGFEADIDNSLEGTISGGNKQTVRTIKDLLEQHTNAAYTDNKPVFKACTIDGYKLIKNYETNKKCQDELVKFFNAQTWYHDTTEQQDNDVYETNRVNNNRKARGFLTKDEKNAKYASEIDDLDIDKDGESYGVWKPTNTIVKTKSIGPIKSRYEKIIKEETFTPKPNSNRVAHSKFLVSVDIVSGEGYILDHSANIPSFTQTTDERLYMAFAKPILLSLDDEDQGSEGKFIKSHHFFCFNFEKDDFDDLMDVIHDTKPRFVMSNYIGKNFKKNEEKSLISDEYNVKSKLSGYVANNKCSKYYKNLYIAAIQKSENRVTSDYLVGELLDKVSMKTLIDNKCLSKYTLNNNLVTVHGFKSRNKPAGWDDKLNKEVSSREDTYKLLGPHLTYNSYGIDPYTIVAKKLGGAFYVSTMAQAGRVEIPSIKTKAFSIYVLKSWKGDGNQKEKKNFKVRNSKKIITIQKDIISGNRHEKLLFSHESNSNKNYIMTGDGNRNVVHPLYAGLNILFESKRLADILRSKVHAVTTYNMYDQDPTSETNKIKATEYTFGKDQYKPGFIHSLIQQDEIVNLKDNFSSDEESMSESDSSEGSGSDDDEREIRRPFNKKDTKRKAVVKRKPKPKPKKQATVKKTKEESSKGTKRKRSSSTSIRDNKKSRG